MLIAHKEQSAHVAPHALGCSDKFHTRYSLQRGLPLPLGGLGRLIDGKVKTSGGLGRVAFLLKHQQFLTQLGTEHGLVNCPPPPEGLDPIQRYSRNPQKPFSGGQVTTDGVLKKTFVTNNVRHVCIIINC